MKKPKEIKYKLSDDVILSFSKWLHNQYARNTIKNYLNVISYLIGGRKKHDNIWDPVWYISKERIIKFLSGNNNIVRQSAIKSFLLFLEEKSAIDISIKRFPRIKKIKKVQRKLKVEDAWIIINNIGDDLSFFAEVLLIGGFRISELVRMKNSWIDFIIWFKSKDEYGDIKVTGAKRDRERIVPVNPILMQKLFDKAEKRDNGTIIADSLLFDFRHDLFIKRKTLKNYGKRNHPILSLEFAEYKYVQGKCSTIQRRLKETADKFLGKKVTPHMFRIARATELDELDVPVTQIRDLLGHSNISTTNTYLTSDPKRLKDSLKEAESNK